MNVFGLYGSNVAVVKICLQTRRTLRLNSEFWADNRVAVVVFIVAVLDRGETIEFPGVVFSQVPMFFSSSVGFSIFS